MIRSNRTCAEEVFDHLYQQILSFELRPGDKLSVNDIADSFGVSRQPVRDAVNRLNDLQLLLIRPQRATIVRKFSMQAINDARLVRLAVELEVARTAQRLWDGTFAQSFAQNVSDQTSAVAAGNVADFEALDRAFHTLIFDAAQEQSVFSVVEANKAQVDRLCLKSLKNAASMMELIDDHKTIVAALSNGNESELSAAMRLHLSRLDDTISAMRQTHAEFFED